MKSIPDVIKVMTPFPYTIGVEESLAAAKSMMEENNIIHLPVTDGEKLSGIITERDIVISDQVQGESSKKNTLIVRDLCVPNPLVVETHVKVTYVLTEMLDQHMGAAIVVKNGRIVGIFTSNDCFQLLLNNYTDGAKSNPPDILA